MHGLNPVPFLTLLIPTLHDLLLPCGKGNCNYILGQIHEIHYISDLGEGARTMSSRAMYKFEWWYTGSPAAAAPSTPPLSCTLYISLSCSCSRYTSFRITILCIFIDFSSIHHIRILREVKSSCLRGICQGNDLDNIFVYCENYTPTQLSEISQTKLCHFLWTLTTSRVSRGVVPVQNRSIPSSVKIRYAQWKEFRYCVGPSRLCIRVLTTLRKFSAQITRTTSRHKL
jgi:hypothetical protein